MKPPEAVRSDQARENNAQSRNHYMIRGMQIEVYDQRRGCNTPEDVHPGGGLATLTGEI